MNWNEVVFLLMAIGLIAFLGVFVYAATMRMMGRRSRFDHLAETMVRAQGAQIYPPSLRPDPEPAVIEEIETTRGTNAGRDAPNAPNDPPQPAD